MIRRVVLPILLVLAANTVILLSASSNRSGRPDAVVGMTEREWRPVPVSERNSARELEWTSGRYEYWQRISWLDAAKLSALGFDCRMPPNDKAAEGFYGRQLPRRVFVVYEFDGASWKDALEEKRRAAQAQVDPSAVNSMMDQVAAEQVSGARLLPVDAGLDPASLRRAYPDSTRFVVLPAVVTISDQWDTRRNAPRLRLLTGSIRAVTATLIVPREFRGALERALAIEGKQGAPRYTVTIAYGLRYEPWIVAIDPVDTPAVRQ